MSLKPNLKIDWCSFEAAKYACLNWHYSKSVPASKLVKIGAWENEQFIGCVIFSRGANANLGKEYGLDATEICELTRVALTKHQTPISRIMRIALNMLKRANPGLRLVVSYADKEQGHHGGIYQAGNWIFDGEKHTRGCFFVLGKKRHARSVGARGWVQQVKWLREHVDPNAKEFPTGRKYKYLMPLDDEMRAKVKHLSKPYPKRPKQAMTGTTGTAEGQHLPGRSISEGGDSCPNNAPLPMTQNTPNKYRP